MKQYVFYCTAGHHLKDSGAVGVGGMKENAFTIKVRDLVAQQVRRKAKQFKLPVKVWTDNDNDTLGVVVEKIRKEITNLDLIIDFHLNSAASSNATGSESVVSDFASQRSQEIGAKLSKIGSDIFEIPNRGVKKEKDTPRKSLAMLKMKGAAVIWEAFFINNPKDVREGEKWLHWVCEEIAIVVINDAKKQLGILN